MELDIFIDDYVATVNSPSEERAVDDLAAAGEDLLTLVEEELSCKVSIPKAELVASTSSLLRKLRARFGEYCGSSDRSAPHLGIDYSAGAPRSLFTRKSVRRQRLDKAGKRTRRIKRLKFTGKTGKLFTTGVRPAADFGSQVFGMSEPELKKLQTTFLACVGSSAGGRSRTLSLLLFNDPCWRSAGGPITQWAKEVWAATSRVPIEWGQRHDSARAQAGLGGGS